MRKYTNLFKQFDKLDNFTKIISQSVSNVTKKSYPTPDTLLKFDESTLEKVY
jgi:hypothetical protein